MTTDPLFRLTWIVTALAGVFGLSLVLSAGATPAAEPAAAHLTSRPRPSVPAAVVARAGGEIRTQAGQRRRLLLPGGVVLYVNQNTTVKVDSPRQATLASGEVFIDAVGSDRNGADFILKTPKRTVTGHNARFAVQAVAKGTAVLATGGKVNVSGLEGAVAAGERVAPEATKPTPAERFSHLLGWTRELMTAFEAPLVPASRHAGGALVAIDPDGQEAKLALRKYHVDVHIEDGFARTTIDQTYFNHSTERLEGTFYFPLPADASLSRLAMYVNGNLMEGGMVERDYARNVYERILYEQKDPALLEWVDGGTFKMRVFPLEPRQEKRIVLSYTQKLPGLYGQAQYRFPAGHSLQTVRDWSFHALVKNGAGRPWNSPSHKLQARKAGADVILEAEAKNAKLDRDVVLRLSEGEQAVRFSSAEQDGQQYLMLRYRPALPSAARAAAVPRCWVVLFETSGDRDPLLARTQIDVVRHLLQQADPRDRFTILTAATRIKALAREPLPATPENIKKAIAFLEQAHLVGALDLGRAMNETASALKTAKNAYLVHLGSGIAAMGERRADVLARRIPEGVRYVGVGVGHRWARGFMKTAAERSGGYFTQINPDEPVAWRAFDLFATLQTPRLHNIQVSAAGRPFLTFASQLAQGEELAAVARFGPDDKGLPESVTVTGTLDGKSFEQVLPVKDVAPNAGYRPRTWAKLEIERLLAEDAAKHKDQIVALSKAMYVMTPYTSLLVLESEEMYVQYKVDRGRKDHWAMHACPKKIKVVREDDPEQTKDSRKPVRQIIDTIVVRERPGILSRANSDGSHHLQQPPVHFPPAAAWRDHSSPYLALVGKPRNSYSVNFYSVIGSTLVGGPKEPMADSDIITKQLLQRVGTTASGRIRGYAMPQSREANPSIPSVFRLPSGGFPDPATALVGRGKLNINSRTTNIQPRLGLALGSEELAIKKLDEAKKARWSAFDHRRRNDEDEALMLRSWGRVELDLGRLYQRPSFRGDDHLFYDLVAYAPGLNTSAADIQAVLEAEAMPDRHAKPGQIDAAARRLLDKARMPGWQALSIPADGNWPAYAILFDDKGRYTYERILPPGLKERVVCDGKTLLHLYPDLGLGARRTVSRFHRADFADLVPWFLPPAEDLVRGADLRLINDHTIVLIPHVVASQKGADGKPRTYHQLQFVFAADGKLSERQIVKMPAAQVVFRETYAADGTVKLLDDKGKELAVRKSKLGAAEEQSLKADIRDLVVLPLPYRTREHILQTLKIKDKPLESLRFADALALLAADFAAGNGDQALAVFKQSFHGRDQRQLGFYVLLAACGQNLDADHVDVMAEHLDEPLAQYLALHSSPLLRKHASQWAVASRQWSSGFLQHLALSHALYQRWQDEKVTKGSPARVKAERNRALEYVKRNQGTLFGWALLGLLQDRAGEDKEFHRALADMWLLFEKVPGLGYAARYEHARSLLQSGQKAEARKRFRGLYEKELAKERLPAIDADFRRALVGDGQDEDLWGDLMRQTAAQLVERPRKNGWR
jgi:hypothetical protein